MATDPDPDLRERVAELEATVETQQATIQQLLPSRRRVLQAGGLLAGGGVLGALTADRASADVTGQVGTQQDRVDVFGGDADFNSLSAKSIGGDYKLAESHTGGDPDSRLDSAISAASDSGTILLENATYNADRTISKSIEFIGTASVNLPTDISATWTLNAAVSLTRCRVGTAGTISVQANSCKVYNGNHSGNFDVNGNGFIFIGNSFGDVTFQSGTSDGVATGNSFSNITDNGSNILGANS